MQLLALAASALALASSVFAQPEAVRFGTVDVTPSTVELGQVTGHVRNILYCLLIVAYQTFTIHYNSTFAELAGHHPTYLDIYIQGTDANGFVQPQYLISRSTFPTNGTKNIYINTTVSIALWQITFSSSYHSLQAPYEETVANASYLIWAYILYPVDTVKPGFLEEGGTSAAIHFPADTSV